MDVGGFVNNVGFFRRKRNANERREQAAGAAGAIFMFVF
jgi:hypothetical protein